MNLLESLVDCNDKLVHAFQSAFLDYLTKRTQSKIEAKPVVFRTSESAFEVTTQCLLRLNQKNNFAPIIIGSSQADFQKNLFELVTPAGAAGATPLDTKAVDVDLIKLVYAAIDADVRGKQVIGNPKVVAPVSNKMLLNWNSVQTVKSMQFPFSTPKGDLIFEIPVISDDYAKERTQNLFGFAFDTRILVVDDAPTTRKLVGHLLTSAGYTNFEECEDGLVAYNKITVASPHYNLIVADWHMPKMSGLDLLKRIRGTTEKFVKDVSVLLVTGERNQEEVLNAIKAGVSGYVVKPFDADTLYKAIMKAAAAKKAKLDAVA